ncbi:terminase large subunit [Clostridium beijerinckii]|uniref:terminase large subunit n=1 Tax=Clostridium beijerinckii TaxID=1520 RepID=UPI00098C2B2E|nr:terminase TerL endonuclease subunit [Clostridium beijerinckii]MBA8935907.1 phage terminase large subunit-like protein [Clostridium beijerinckii]NRU35979.1 phage terminase large subunit-like protein [Clostridium beijerinckii]NSB00740.1 phage terminase large subunit-like protein [Clostridium beijerinckii]OOM53868.1 phage terminase [Clostridium beijerinckii]OOM66979.1 phage terminase [Clostridium beijerinckii]
MILLEKAIKYANDVVNGEEITTKEVVQQCTIFLDDYYKNQKYNDFEFYFDEKKLKTINDLLKLLNFATGFVAGKQVLENLAEFQCFFIANIFGWRFKDKSYKFRYNDNTLFIARKNSKTALIGIVFILLLLTEQQYSEFYSICLTKELSAEIKKSMEQIIGASPLIKKHFKVSTTKTGSIKCLLTGSFFEPRTAEAGKNNSVRPSAFVSDEHGNFSENSNFNAMKSGMKNVLNGLVFRTTTAYEINNSIMEEDLDYIRKVLEGTLENERQFALIYYATEEHLWDDIGIYMANPLRIEENYNTMREDRKIALEKPSAKGEYLTKTMNVFLQENKDEAYMDMNLWKKCMRDKIDFNNKEIIVAVDGSISLDLTSVSIMYKENGQYYCMSHGFLPKENMADRREKIDYFKMERNGYCDIHEGFTVNYNLLEEYIRNIEPKYNCKIKCIISDPFNMKQTMENLAEEYEVILLKQTFTNLTVATKAFRDMVYNEKVYYEKNELLDWCVSNAILNVGKSGDVMLAKDKAMKNRKRIDMLATLIFCMTELYIEEEGYDAVKALEAMNW